MEAFLNFFIANGGTLLEVILGILAVIGGIAVMAKAPKLKGAIVKIIAVIAKLQSLFKKK